MAAAAPTGLIVGRFCPPHLGHSYLITVAAGRVERLVVFVTTREDEPIPGAQRAGWLAELHPDVRVVEVRHALTTNFDDPDLWDRWMALFRGHWPYPDGPHVVFSSEGYGDELARRFGASAVAVDPARRTVPISATMIRERPLDHLAMLAPPVAEWVEAWGRTRQRPAAD